ncbi:hypothetical protein ACHQM5_021392 [Ranunculus cassubicifolius]
MKYSKLKHFSHDHILKPECSKIPYICDGCQEPGTGVRFRCKSCNYDLHLECALASPTINHPFCGRSTLEFLVTPPPNKFCNACRRDVLGFSYRCEEKDYDLHPSCAKLRLTIECDGKKLDLRESNSLHSRCGICGSKESKSGMKDWSYRSTCKKYHFHVSCMKSVGVENWEKDYFARKNSDVELSVIPNLQIMRPNGRSSRGGKMERFWRIAQMVLKLVISAVIGDPVAAVVGVVGYLLEN